MFRGEGNRPAIFLDRDGTLNVEKNYLHKPADWEWIPGSVQAIRQINEMGWLAIVVTNQAGIARGFYQEEDVTRLHRHVDGLLAAAGARIDAYYMCPHHPDFGALRNCDCRKPQPGLLLRAASEFLIDLPASFMAGDKESDMQAAQRAGVTPILVATGYGSTEDAAVAKEIGRADTLLAAVEGIRSRMS
jgi:D-glycero-D-manno-heptose 1,7-bisphosphate phosphatase